MRHIAFIFMVEYEIIEEYPHETDKNLTKFFFGEYITFCQVPKSLSKPTISKVSKNKIAFTKDSDSIFSPPNTQHIVCVECHTHAVFWKVCNDETVLDIALQATSTNRPKYPRLDQLDNGSNSTIQLTHVSTSNNMKIGMVPAVLELFDFF